MQFQGIIIAIGVFLIIGILHPIVIKAEYYFSKNVWPVFLVSGLVCISASLFIENTIPSVLLAVLGSSLLWSIHELIEQEERVKKGWFPQNPDRQD
jgi:hypothetical protein